MQRDGAPLNTRDVPWREHVDVQTHPCEARTLDPTTLMVAVPTLPSERLVTVIVVLQNGHRLYATAQRQSAVVRIPAPYRAHDVTVVACFSTSLAKATDLLDARWVCAWVIDACAQLHHVTAPSDGSSTADTFCSDMSDTKSEDGSVDSRFCARHSRNSSSRASSSGSSFSSRSSPLRGRPKCD